MGQRPEHGLWEGQRGAQGPSDILSGRPDPRNSKGRIYTSKITQHYKIVKICCHQHLAEMSSQWAPHLTDIEAEVARILKVLRF